MAKTDDFGNVDNVSQKPGNSSANKKGNRREKTRQRILRSTAVLPSFVTILNGLAGLGAIHFATKEAFGTLSSTGMGNLKTAAWFIALAIVLDMLDGRLARMTRRTSDFGGQLDSLCDAISFGVAPAILMLRAVVPMLLRVGELGHDWHLDRVVWSIAAIYVSCGVIRLARFNVENEPDESAHMDFRGLPIPGAAAAVGSLVLLLERLTRIIPNWTDRLWLLITSSVVMLVMSLAVALLMVSQFKYVHVVNHYIRGKRPPNYLIKLVVAMLAGLWQPFATIAIVTNGYAISGPTLTVWTKIRPKLKKKNERT